MKLYYVDKITDPLNNKIMYEFEPKVKRQAIRAQTAINMTKALVLSQHKFGLSGE